MIGYWYSQSWNWLQDHPWLPGWKTHSGRLSAFSHAKATSIIHVVTTGCVDLFLTTLLLISGHFQMGEVYICHIRIKGRWVPCGSHWYM